MPNRLQMAAIAVISFFSLAVATSILPARAGLQGGIIENWSIASIVGSSALIALCGFLMPLHNKPIAVYAAGILFAIVTPALVLFSSGGLPVWFPIVVIIGFLIVLGTSHLPLRLPAGAIPPAPLFWLILILCVAYVGAVLYFSGFEYLNLDLSRVYEFREDASRALPRAFGYIMPIATGVAMPVGVALALYLRKLWAVALFVVLSVLAMALTGHKSVLVAPFIVIAVFFVVRSRRPILLMASLLFAGIAVCSVDSVFFLMGEDLFGFKSGWIASLGIRRALLIPSLLNWYYLDLFTKLDTFYWWSTSRITFGLVEKPFDVTAPFLVGKEYFAKEGVSTNTGFIGSGFAQAGFFGIALYSCGIGLILAVIKATSRDRPSHLVSAMVAIPLLKAITSADLLTALLTHGLALSLLITLLLRTNPNVGARPSRHS